MGVDYDSVSGIGFAIGSRDTNRDKIMAKIMTEAKNNGFGTDVLEYIYEGKFTGFCIEVYGDYCYSGDLDDLGLLLVKENYKADDGLFIEALNSYFDITFSKDSIGLVSGVWVS